MIEKFDLIRREIEKSFLYIISHLSDKIELGINMKREKKIDKHIFNINMRWESKQRYE